MREVGGRKVDDDTAPAKKVEARDGTSSGQTTGNEAGMRDANDGCSRSR